MSRVILKCLTLRLTTGVLKLQCAAMLFVAIAPAFFWASVLLAVLGWLTISYRRQPVIVLAPTPYVIGFAQGALAGLALYLTAQGSISSAVCLTGILGMPANIIFGLGILGTLFAFLIASRRKALAALGANVPFFLAIALLQVIVILILMRSAMLCTV